MNKNFIAGEWLEGADINLNINPSDTNDVVGEYARADASQAAMAVDAAFEAAPNWARSTAEVRSDALDHIGTEILARREELGRLLAREEGKTLPEGIGEVVRAGRVFKFLRAKHYAFRANAWHPFALGLRPMYGASQRAWSVSSLPGTSLSQSQPGRSPLHWRSVTQSFSNQLIWCLAVRGHWRKLLFARVRFPPECSIWSWGPARKWAMSLRSLKKYGL